MNVTVWTNKSPPLLAHPGILLLSSMTAKLALRDLENEKLSLTNQVNNAHPYLVLQLLTTQNPQQNHVVISTSKHSHDSTK